MKLRTLGILLLASISLTSVKVYALGFGELQVNSALDEPLDVRIQLSNVGELSEVEMLVGLASPEEFKIAGVEREFYLTALQFDVDLSNPRSPAIRVTTRNPVSEPYLDFLVRLEWPTGKLLREYTVLLDLPTFVNKLPVATKVQPAATSSSIPAKSNPPPFQPDLEPGAEYQVEGGDTLWSIAKESRPNGYSINQSMTAIQQLNPSAFINNDINRLKKGSILRLPKGSQMDNLLAAEPLTPAAEPVVDTAAVEDSAEDELFSSEPEDSTESSAYQRVTETENAESAGRLKLSALASADLTGLEPTSGTGSNDGETASVDAEQVTALEEELTRTQRENEDLKTRLANLEEQLELKERMLEVQSETATALQQAPAIQAEQEQSTTRPAAKPAKEEKGIMSWLIYIVIAVVGLLIALLLFFKNKRKSDDQEFEPLFGAAGLADEKDDMPEFAAVADELEEEFDSPVIGSYEDANEYAEDSIDLELSDEEEIDPLEQADIYLSLGNEEEAENILQSALQKDSGNADAHLMLLDIYCRQLNLPRFDMQRAELARLDNDDANAKAEDLRNKLLSLEEQAQTEQEEETVALDDVEVESLEEDFSDKTGLAIEETGEQGHDESVAEESSLDLDQLSSDIDSFDLDSVFEDEDTEQDAAGDLTEVDLSEENEVDIEQALADLDAPEVSTDEETIESSPEEIDIDDEIILEEQPEPQTEEPAVGADEVAEEQFIADEPVDESALQADIDVEQECATKLELAQAYIDMGDSEGATEILQEVIDEGSDQQREKAQALLDSTS